MAADGSSTAITDLTQDSLVHCATYLNRRDISNLASTCKYLNRVAYSDSIWQRLSRELWPSHIPLSFPNTMSVREAYLARHTALRQLKFIDPLVSHFYTEAKPFDHLLLDRNHILFSQGSLVRLVKIDSFLSGRDGLVTLSDHRARISCMRLFPLSDTSFFRNETQRDDNVLVTASCDHSIRLWWKGSCQRCFRGHNAPVTVLSDKLLGDNNSGKILASGGLDGTVRLWSLSSSGKRGQHALKATLYGHEKPIVFMSTAGHKNSILVSLSRDSKVRVWDTTASSATRSTSCVGETKVVGSPVGMKCQGPIVYIAAGTSVVAIDLRTMQRAFTAETHLSKLCSFDIVASKHLLCTGGIDRAMIWDIRRSSETPKTQPIAELDGHYGPITQLHMDPYKVVTGTSTDLFVKVWDSATGVPTNSLICSTSSGNHGCCAMAVDGCRIVTGVCEEEQGLLTYWDFGNATCPVSSRLGESDSKFWGPLSSIDSDESDY
ncbi:dynein assembly factor with WDR repeat domains 1-like [Impatiens glandulifera]|uniref:dynein assembly factor with WDR repeat domains 1-like n=1 Tax=Impatiens glandulifera TaxID=253017 RepID=UPI001FB0EC90|nr:dynein assembly factor with WDR repeat domains 1-like [Impatiens glandulifera]